MILIGVKDGVVEACISANSVADVVDFYPDLTFTEQVGDENVGWTFDGVTFHPPAGVTSATPTRITKLAFENRFTDEEAIAVDLASLDATPLAAALRRAQRRINLAQYIDLNDPSLATGVSTLEALGLLGPGRAAEILYAPPTATELYTG